jgi:hypothetical protein
MRSFGMGFISIPKLLVVKTQAKGMHWKTYERLWWEHHEADMEQLAGLREWLDRFEEKVG